MTTAKIILTLSLAAVLGGGYLFYRAQSQEPKDVPTRQAAENNGDASFTGSLTDLLKLGSNAHCTFTYADNGSSIDGEVYLADKGQRLRGDFELEQTDGSMMTSSVIQDGGYGYVWSSAFEGGYKMALDEESSIFEAATSGEASSATSAIPDENVTYDCDAWVVNDSMFTPPANINFVDVSSQVETMMQNLDVSGDQLCSACEQLSGGARTACLQNLGCN